MRLTGRGVAIYVAIYLTEKKYKEAKSKAPNFCVVNEEMIFKKKLRGTKEVTYISCRSRTYKLLWLYSECSIRLF